MSKSTSPSVPSPELGDRPSCNDEHNIREALRAHVDVMCGMFDEDAVRIDAKDGLTLRETLSLSGVDLVGLWDKQREKWITQALDVAISLPAPIIRKADRASTRTFIMTAYEDQAQRLMRHIETTIGEELDRRAKT